MAFLELKKSANRTAARSKPWQIQSAAGTPLCRLDDMKASPKEREGRKEGKKFPSENTAGFVRHPIDDAFDSVFQVNFAEVDQQTDFAITQTKLREHLLGVNLGKT